MVATYNLIVMEEEVLVGMSREREMMAEWVLEVNCTQALIKFAIVINFTNVNLKHFSL